MLLTIEDSRHINKSSTIDFEEIQNLTFESLEDKKEVLLYYEHLSKDKLTRLEFFFSKKYNQN